MPRPIQAEINLQALSHNLHVAKQHGNREGRAARVWAVVKADAYGHGLMKVWSAFRAADGLALLEFEQADRLRQAGYAGRLLMMEGAFDEYDLKLAFELNLGLVIHCQEQLEMLESFWLGMARQATLPKRLDIFLKFNSGMNRLGFSTAGFRAARERLRALPALNELTLMTHFADSDVEGGADEAIVHFDAACQGFNEAQSMANSAATLVLPSTHRQWVRPGVMLYGATPFAATRADQSAHALGLQAAMMLSSELIAVQSLEAGSAVGYGSTFKAERAMRIGVVACGYADGYPRHAPTGTPILVEGQRTRTVGRVAMDMMMVDLTAVPAAHVGSRVELWGASLSIDEVALHAGTIGYELMCAVAPRVPKIYSSV
jgi:alanine racemase